MEADKLISEVWKYLDYRNTEIELQRTQGVFFNLFQVLGIETKETRHSAFLAELLNPRGSHGQQDRFLRLFIQQLPCLREIQWNTQNAYARIEEVIPDNNNYGRMDIVIHCGDDAIIIENKIYAGDQEEQLYRYHEYGKSHIKGKTILIYLTLEGGEASKSSTNEQLVANVDYFPISYSSEIDAWLTQCENAVRNLTNLYATINQYHQIINKLTNKNMAQDTHILDLMLENNKAVLEIINNRENWEQQIKEKATLKFKEVLKDIAEQRGLKLIYKDSNDSFEFVENDDSLIAYTFECYGTTASKWYYGVRPVSGNEYEGRCKLDCFNQEATPYWPLGWQWFDEELLYQTPYWRNQYYVDLLDENHFQTFVDYIRCKLDIMISETKKHEEGIAKVLNE
jgi:hypothetical protein